jgi:hypothetical protein
LNFENIFFENLKIIKSYLLQFDGSGKIPNCVQSKGATFAGQSVPLENLPGVSEQRASPAVAEVSVQYGVDPVQF